MPIYEFECRACGTRFESIVGAGTESAPCEQCGAEGTERRMSNFAAPIRQMTASQRRSLEDKRGANRGGARQRWKETMGRVRASGEAQKRPPDGSGGASGSGGG
ncbi:MAG: zinc ribbon domain-containing protein [Solirubrobacterales bacterium]